MQKPAADLNLFSTQHGPETFKQGLKVGDVASFETVSEKYSIKNGWTGPPVRAIVTGFEYPSIKTSAGSFHYSRLVLDRQLPLF